jgi:hypothetical protein
MTEQTNVITVQNGNVPYKSLPSLEDFKALYYFMNAKPDTQIRLMQGKRIVDVSDIRKINEQITSKLLNHNVNGSITSITIVIGKNDIRDYSSWTEFERENWDTINGQTRSIMVVWDILIKLPQYNIPQRHTLKLRIGQALPPSDMIQLVMSSDNPSELMEAHSDAVCKIDFINQVLASELLAIVTNWYEGLHEPPKIVGFQLFFTKKQSTLISLIGHTVKITILAISVYFANFFCVRYNINNLLTLSNINWVVLFFLILHSASSFIAHICAKWVDDKIDDYEEYNRFIITKGDDKAVIAIEQQNDNITKEIKVKIIIGIVTAFITVIFKLFFEYLLK